MTTPAQRIGEVGARLAADGIDDALADDVAGRIVDVLGNSLAAVREEPARIAGAVVAEWGGQPAATAIGLPGRVPAPRATLRQRTREP